MRLRITDRTFVVIALAVASLAAPAVLAQGFGRGAAFRALLLSQGTRRGAAPKLLGRALLHFPQTQPAPPPQSPQAAPGQQPAAPPAAQAEEGAPLSKLGLSDDQKKQIHKIRKQSQEQVQAIKKDTSLTEQQQNQQIRQVRRNASQQVDGVLTPEQHEKFDAWRKAHARRRRPQPQQQPAKPNGE